MKNGARQDAQDLKDAGNTGLEAEARPANPVNSQAGKPALQKKEPRELAGGETCATEGACPPTEGYGAAGGGEAVERPANQDKSRQIKVENQSKVQGPESKVQGLDGEMAGLKRDARILALPPIDRASVAARQRRPTGGNVGFQIEDLSKFGELRVLETHGPNVGLARDTRAMKARQKLISAGKTPAIASMSLQ